MKESGIGREHCRETLNIYSELKAITVQNSLPQPGFAV
ncbi:aldehyde dehydrogenase [Alcaligenes sp. HPC1271]|nr:aldehyde dehydrogenase [Alcaligenes sp. HPC1271]